MPPQLTATVVPTGGAVLLQMPGYFTTAAIAAAGTVILSRAVSGASGLGAFTQLYAGRPIGAWVDAGDLLPSPLLAGNGYVYQLVDQTGAVQVGPAFPASALVQPATDSLTELFIRLIQGGIGNLALPAGINPVQVTTQMPLGGWQALPFIVVNMDLVQQQDTMIGEDVLNPDANNNWTIPVYAKRMWRITVLSRNAKERDFYRDSLIAIWRVLKATVFAQIGLDMRHDFQAASGTDVNEWEGKAPGFYYADVMCTIEGAYDNIILTNYLVIKEIAVGVTPIQDPVIIPPSL